MSQDTSNGGKATIREVYGLVETLRGEFQEGITGVQAILERVLDDHEQRIRSLEHWHWRVAGVLVVFSILVSPALFVLYDFLTRPR